MTPEVALASCRFVHDASVMLLWGALGFLAFLAPTELGHAVADQLVGLRFIAVPLALGTTVAALPIEAATIGDGWADARDAATLRAVLLETSVGLAWMAQLAGALLLATAALLPRRVRLPATAATSGVLLAMLATQGHAVMQEGGLGVAHRLNDAIHVLAAGAWFGTLVPLLFILRKQTDAGLRSQAGVALRRFSAAGHGAVATVILTGAANTALTLGRWPTDWSSPYQAWLSAKIAIVALMTSLALANRYIIVPRIKMSGGKALHALRVSTMIEIGLGAMAIGCVGVFGLFEPV